MLFPKRWVLYESRLVFTRARWLLEPSPQSGTHVTTPHLFNECINDFGRFIGLSGLHFDQDGICPLAAGDVRIFMCQDIENGRLKLYTILDEQMPATPDPDWTRRALQAALEPLNDDRVPRLGMESMGNRLVAYFTLPIGQLQAVSIAECVDNLIEYHHQWPKRKEQSLLVDTRPAAFHSRA